MRLNNELSTALHSSCSDAKDDSNSRNCATGAGRAFCAGRFSGDWKGQGEATT